MERDYIGNLRAAAGVHGNSISEQNVELLCEKYDLTEAERADMLQYCREQGISIYNEEENESDFVDVSAPAKYEESLTEEQEEAERLVNAVSERIMHVALVKLQNRRKRRVQLCGFYLYHKERKLAEKVKRIFTIDQLRFINDHLLTFRDEEESFALEDPREQELCAELNNKLNALLHRLL